MNMEHWLNDSDRTKTEVLGEKPVLVPLGPPQIEGCNEQCSCEQNGWQVGL
jgi:hypothetical protein